MARQDRGERGFEIFVEAPAFSAIFAFCRQSVLTSDFLRDFCLQCTRSLRDPFWVPPTPSYPRASSAGSISSPIVPTVPQTFQNPFQSCPSLCFLASASSIMVCSAPTRSTIGLASTRETANDKTQTTTFYTTPHPRLPKPSLFHTTNHRPLPSCTRCQTIWSMAPLGPGAVAFSLANRHEQSTSRSCPHAVAPPPFSHNSPRIVYIEPYWYISTDWLIPSADTCTWCISFTAIYISMLSPYTTSWPIGAHMTIINDIQLVYSGVYSSCLPRSDEIPSSRWEQNGYHPQRAGLSTH
jgi:hypothetical protein